MFRSKAEATLRHMGLEPRALRAADAAPAAFADADVAAAIVDLGLGEPAWRLIVASARAARPPRPVLAFGAHVDREAQRAARAAGCTLVVANSRLARELPALVERLLAASPGESSPDEL